MIRERKDAITISRGKRNVLTLPATDADGYIPAGIAYVRWAASWNHQPNGVFYTAPAAVTTDSITGDKVFELDLPAQYAAPLAANVFIEVYWQDPDNLNETRFADNPCVIAETAVQDVATGMQTIRFIVTGQATVAQMAGSATVVRGSLTGWSLVNQAGAPVGADLEITLKRGATAFDEIIILPEEEVTAADTFAAADTENGDVITAWVTQIGTAPDEGGDLVLDVYFIPGRASGA